MNADKFQKILFKAMRRVRNIGGQFELYKGMGTKFVHIQQKRVNGTGVLGSIDFLKRIGVRVIWS
jgi:hypothetical protein